MTDLFLKYLHSQVSLDVCQQRPNEEFEEIQPRKQPQLDYQQQINLYKKYTELKKSPHITQSQEFNRRISVVIEKTGGTTSSGVGGASASGHTSRPKSSDLYGKTQSAVESTSSSSIAGTSRMTTDGSGSNTKKSKSKSQSTTQIDKQGSMNSLNAAATTDMKHSSSANNNSKSNSNNRAVSQSPQRSGSVRRGKHQDEAGADSKRSARVDEAKKSKPNGFIKRLSMRFKSLSIENNDQQHQQQQHRDQDHERSSNDKKLKRTDSEKRKQKSKEEIYSEQYANHMNREKAIRSIMNSSGGPVPATANHSNHNERQHQQQRSTTTTNNNNNYNYYPVNNSNNNNRRLENQNSNEIDIESKCLNEIFLFEIEI